MIDPAQHDLPELMAGEYLPDMMFKVGPLRMSGEAMVATDWPVLMAFSGNQALSADDTDILADMCRGYCSAMRDGESPLGIAPVDQEDPKDG